MCQKLKQSIRYVIPAQAGIHKEMAILDPRLRGDDNTRTIFTFYRTDNMIRPSTPRILDPLNPFIGHLRFVCDLGFGIWDFTNGDMRSNCHDT